MVTADALMVAPPVDCALPVLGRGPGGSHGGTRRVTSGFSTYIMSVTYMTVVPKSRTSRGRNFRCGATRRLLTTNSGSNQIVSATTDVYFGGEFG
jgi:hypothetical protein